MDKFINAGAVISGGPVWLLSRILRSPDVARVLGCPPSWIERDALADTVTAIHLAARAFEVSLAAPERGETATLSAVVPHSAADWTTREAAEHLRMSQRRVQELAAAELGGRLVGREWRIPEVAVREYGRTKAGNAA